MTDTLFDAASATKTDPPSGVTATLTGWLPTDTEATTRVVWGSTTEARVEPPAANERNAPPGLRTTPRGLLPAGSVTVVAIVLVPVSNTETASSPLSAI